MALIKTHTHKAHTYTRRRSYVLLLAHNGRSKTYEREKNCGCKRLYVGILVVHQLNPEIKKCLSFSPFFLSFTFLSCLLFYILPLALFTKLS